MISLRSLGLMFLAVVAAVLLVAAPGHAQSALTASFNHFSTGFPLTGSHLSVDCASCHINGRFKATPKQCFACHNSANAAGKSQSHPQTTNQCESCHLTTTWRDMRFIDHVQTTAPCATCHNGTIALGKSVNHLVTTASCGTCHRNTVSYAGATPINHAGITTGCASCHNGTAALGKSANHVATTAPCESCHTSTTTWAGATFTHAATDTNCSSCHNGSGALGLTTPPHVPVAGVQCGNCHTNTAPSFATYTMNHASVSASRCDACHNGSFAAEGTKGAQGTASFPGHVATNGRDCGTCHTSAAAAFASWAGGTFTHAATDTNCSNCHNGTTATGMSTPPHVPVTGVQCSNCHTNTATSFATYTMNHAAVSPSRCDACHSGTFAAEGTKGAQGTASFPGHVATGGRDCITCHTSAASAFTSWAGGAFVHAATDTNCSGCHNGTTATGMKTPPHVPVTGVQCSNCHVNTAASFTTYTMNHGSVSASRCDACHNGSFVAEGTKGAQGTASLPGHVATAGRDCGTCHASAAAAFTSWAGGTFTHAATDTNCSNCHNGTTATGMATPPHVPVTGVQCSNCHANTAASFTTYTMNHSSVSASRCDSCHNGSFTAEGTKGAQGTASLPGHVATAGRDCGTCHASAAAAFTSWAGGTFAHAATDTNCSNCHNGTTATGMKTPPHVPVTGVQCSSCHVNTAASFTTYTMNHSAVSASRCDACHNGSFVAEGTKGAQGTASFPGHVVTGGRDCGACHTSAASTFTSWAGGTFTHAATDTNCSTCHNGTTATGMTTPPHVPATGVQCSSCHVNTAASFTTYTMNHPAVSASRCDSCHNGSFTAEGTKGAQGTASLPGHVATGGRDCGTCHASAAAAFTSWAGGTFTHAATDTNCSSCHNGTTATGLKTPPHVPVTGVQCSSCHVNTAASFTTYTMNHGSVSASRCDSCHNGSFTAEGTKGAQGTASLPGHVATGGRDCGTCHASAAAAFTSWAGGTFAHAATDTNCSSCHNGTTATGMTMPPHIPATGVQCSNCHANTAASFTTYTMGVTGHGSVSTSRCDACHNGSYTSQGTKGALGTASFAGHVATNGKDCITCHASATSAFTSWAGGAFTHAATDTNCSSCHNGTTATGMTTPPHIPAAGVQCSSCHNNTAASFTTYTMNYTAVSTSRCDACHNGSYTSQGTKGALGTASFAGHVPTSGADCITCHASAASGFASWAGGAHVHAATDTNCSSCHNGTTATGMVTPPHIPVTGLQCSSCHTNTAASFTTYTMSHTAVASSRCDSCHNGLYVSQGTSGAQAKASGHIPTGAADCTSCHASTASFDSGGSSATCKMVHAVVTGVTCATCHNGVNAKGNHGSGPNCGSCHTAKDTACGKYGVGATVVAVPAAAKVVATTPPAAAPAAAAKGAATTTTTSGTVVTKPTTAVTTATTIATKPTTAVTTATTIATKPTTTAATAAMTAVSVPATKSATAATTVTTAAPATATAATTAVPPDATKSATTASITTSPGTAVVNNALPGAVVSGAAVPNLPTFAAPIAPTSPSANTASANTAGTKMNHAGITSGCAACHNGVAALGKPPNHIVTTAPCESCHKTTVTFAGARMNHAGIIANCASCHNGRTATGKPANHIITTAACETCHKSTVTFAGARVDHSRITATCVSCHNGTLADGKSPRHFVTTLPCDTCHRSVTWTPVNYRHASPAYVNHGAALNCTSCHTSNAQTVPWKFPAFRPDCAGCHVDKYRPMSHPKFERPVKVYYTAAELRDCAGACHIFTDNTQKTILTRRTGVHRAIGGGW